jgi:hypothetical protein
MSEASAGGGRRTEVDRRLIQRKISASFCGPVGLVSLKPS